MKAIEIKLDRLWSKKIFIKYGGRCAMCGGQYNLSPHHGIAKRRHKNTRWDERNGFLLCQQHHTLAETQPLFFKNWVIKRYGQDYYDEVKQQSLLTFDRDYEKVEEEL